MQTVKIDDYDSTCFDASVSAGHFNDTKVEYAAIPDTYTGIVRTTSVARKHSSNYICLQFADKSEVRIASFIESTPEIAIEEAAAALKEAAIEETDLSWWKDVD